MRTVFQEEPEIGVGPVDHVVVFLAAVNKDDPVAAERNGYQVLFFEGSNGYVIIVQSLCKLGRNLVGAATFVRIDINEAVR